MAVLQLRKKRQDPYVIELILDVLRCESRELSHGHLPRGIIDIAMMAMLDDSQSIQSHTGLSFCSEKVVNSAKKKIGIIRCLQ